MNKNLTEIVVVLDKSGSMGSVREDTIGGFNTFLQDQKELPGEALFTLVMFDTYCESNYQGALLESVQDLSMESYKPSGTTALLDAVGKTINDVVTRHEALEEDKKPGKTILVVLTDGHENSSSEYTNVSAIGKMIKDRENAGWEILFLGADIDAWGDGRNMGFSKMSGVDKNDMVLNMKKMSNYTANYRVSAQNLDMTDVNATFSMSKEELDKEMEQYKNKK